MNTAIAHSLSDPSTINRKAAEEDIETQILFRKSIFEEIEKEDARQNSSESYTICVLWYGHHALYIFEGVVLHSVQPNSKPSFSHLKIDVFMQSS